MVPDLSIGYSSGGGAGTLGLGWSLNGLPSISRCSQTFAQDGAHGGVNYDANDRFCLNGQRLIALSGTYGANGTEYRTEIDDDTKIISYGVSGSGPTYFKVWTRAGRIMEFGNTADSRVQPAGTTASIWSLNKITDPAGNYLTVTYNSATGTDRTTNGEIYPTRIDYTGNAGASLATYNSVQFTYTARNTAAVVPAYRAGYVRNTTVLLSDIKTYTGSTLVSDYKLAYTLATSGAQNDELTSVTECDGSVTPVCLPPLTFGWQGTRDSLNYTTATTNVAFLGTSNSYPINPMDLNGDGLTDAVVTITYDGSTYTPACPSTGNIFLGSLDGSFTASNFTVNGTANGCVHDPSGADVNGDGLDDVLQTGGTYNNAVLLANDGNNHLTTFATVNGRFVPYAFAELNGDGKLDYLKSASNSAPWYGDNSGTFTQGTSFALISSVGTFFGDFDGNGCTDIVFQDVNSTTGSDVHYLCGPAVADVTTPNFSSYTNLITADFNGDGLDDILALGASNALFLSTGTGFTSYSVSFLASTGISTGDWNADGKIDLAISSGGQITLYLSTGTGFEVGPTFWGSSPSVGDWNSDGAGDLWVKSGGTSDTEYLFTYTPEYVHTISNGLGAVITVTYDRLNKNGSFYTKGTGSSFPTQDQDGPTYVVSEVSSTNGIGGNHILTYAYSGKKQDVSGRGSLGFSQTTLTDAQTGVVQTTSYRTDFPYTGAIASQTITSGATTLSSTTNTYSLTTSNGISGTHYYDVLLSESATTRNDLDGTALPGITTDYTYDSYLNPLTITKTVTDGSSSTVTNTYSNDTTHWILGELTSSATTNTVPDAGANAAPIAAPDTISTAANTAVTSDPRANDIDPDGDAITISSAANGSHGTVAVNGGVSVTYTPSSGYNGTDSFTYVISDGHSHTASSTVTVAVGDQPPLAVGDNISTDEDTADTFDPRVNDSDPEGDTLTVTSATNGTHGAVTVNSGTSLTYTPTTGYSGSDSFNYTISDGHNTSTAAVAVSINNRPPVANNDSVSAGENAATTFDPRANDSDPDSDSITITGTTAAAHGAVSVTGGTSVTYTPATGYTGTDSFTYSISDSHGHVASATVTMTVSNLPPNAVNDSVGVTMNVTKTFDPRTNDSDPEGDALTITAKTNGSHGTVTFTGTSVTYTPSTGYTGSDSFTYTISDGHGNTATATVSVTVAANQAPTAVNDTANTPGNSRTVDIYPLGNDTDPDGDTLTITSNSSPTSGSVTLHSGTYFTFTGPLSWKTTSGLESQFTYTISDGHSHTATATITVWSTGCVGPTC